jgi:hypothetical protein
MPKIHLTNRAVSHTITRPLRRLFGKGGGLAAAC